MELILRPKDLRTEIKQAIRKNKNVDGHPNVYYVNSSLVAKRGETNERTRDEYDMGNYLFGNGIRVPKMHSLIELDSAWLRFGHFNSHSNLVFLMQRIPGETILYSKCNNKYAEATQLLKEELKKVSKLDLITMDMGKHNAIFNPHDGNVYLIDFDLWSRMSDKRPLPLD